MRTLTITLALTTGLVTSASAQGWNSLQQQRQNDLLQRQMQQQNNQWAEMQRQAQQDRMQQQMLQPVHPHFGFPQ